MALLRPLLLDNVPSIQQSAALALGRLASYSSDLAESVVSSQILPQLVYSLAEQNVIEFFDIMELLMTFNLEILQESSCFCIKSCSKT